MKNNKISKIGIQLNKIMVTILFLIFFVPIIIKFEAVNFISPKLGIPLGYTATYFNYFNVIKFDITIYFCLLLLLLFIVYIFYEDIKLSNLDYLIALIMIIVLFSTFLSNYKTIAL
ncbi:MAG: hypothetical protein EOM04_08330, partial [Clostridia bacterium]|nr:hypothetical protein [Clostridia bacterium]